MLPDSVAASARPPHLGSAAFVAPARVATPKAAGTSSARNATSMPAGGLSGSFLVSYEAVLLERGERVFHLPGMAVNRAREGYRS